MKPIDEKDPLSKSKDVVAENISFLKLHFPDVFAEGKIDFEKLKENLGEYVDEEKERFNFTWNGKQKARKEAQKQSTGTLRPCPEESVNWDTTQNLYLEGDNLEVLKLLQKSYHNKVKMIYIDPPYNTGKDFVYKDNYSDNLRNYLEISNQLDDEGRKLSTNSDALGRYHSNWLNMMYPRLKLARNLLKEDGVIFISIDDNEVHNLRELCNEVFGEENFLAQIAWKRKKETSSDSKGFGTQGEFVLSYAKGESFTVQFLPLSKEYIERSYKKPNEVYTEGMWRPVPIATTKGHKSGGYTYSITTPGGRVIEREWAYPQKSYEQLLQHGRIYFGKDGNGIPQRIVYSHEMKGIPPSNYWDNVASNKQGKTQLLELFETGVFDTVKPIELLQEMFKISLGKDDLILDFFSGSATTAHAVYLDNLTDDLSRKFILVQIPEPTDPKSEAYKAGFSTIAEIGKERIRRAIQKIEKEEPEKAKAMDLGFKVLKLDSSNLKTWDPDPEQLEKSLFDTVQNVKEGRTDDDLLYEVLLKFGLDLTLPTEEKSFDGDKVFSVGMGALMVCFNDEIALETVEKLGEWKEELAPEICRVVFRDSGFKSDAVKANAIQILKRFGIQEVRSL